METVLAGVSAAAKLIFDHYIKEALKSASKGLFKILIVYCIFQFSLTAILWGVTYGLQSVSAPKNGSAAPVTSSVIVHESSDPIDFSTGLICPVPGSILSQPYGPSSLWLEPPYGQYLHFHTGMDLASPDGTAIRSAESGEVISAYAQVDSGGSLIAYGNNVKIKGVSGLVELYGHMKSFIVQPSQFVSKGELIGYMDSSGWSTGSHVHFEVRERGVPIDPAPLMSAC